MYYTIKRDGKVLGLVKSHCLPCLLNRSFRELGVLLLKATLPGEGKREQVSDAATPPPLRRSLRLLNAVLVKTTSAND